MAEYYTRLIYVTISWKVSTVLFSLLKKPAVFKGMIEKMGAKQMLVDLIIQVSVWNNLTQLGWLYKNDLCYWAY